MAVVKISELDALTAPAAGDIMIVNDVSEAAEADRTKNIRMDDIVIFEASQLSTGIVTEAKIGAGAVTNTKLGADAVDGDNIADDSIDSEHIAAGAIDTEHIGDDQVTAAKTSFLDGMGSVNIYAGYIDHSANRLPSGWSYSKNATGEFRITHGGDLATNAAIAVTQIGTKGYAIVALVTSTLFQVNTYNSSGTAVDIDFSFIAITGIPAEA